MNNKINRQEFFSGVSAITGDPSKPIGFLTWYSVGDDLYNREDLRKLLIQNNLEESFLPNPIRPGDAFRRATKAVETKRYREEETAEEYRNFIIRDVVSTGEKLQRNIVIETVNQKGERLDYNSEGAKLYFDRKNDQFTYSSTDPYAEELAQEAQKYYESYLTHHNGASVRASVVQMLNTLSPTPVRPSGGVYFVPVQHEAKLRNIVSFLMGLPRGEGQLTALVNDETNQVMIRGKVQENLDKVLGQCRYILKPESESSKTQVKTVIEDARRIVSQFKDYRELLTDTVVDLESSVELVRQAITAVLQKED